MSHIAMQQTKPGQPLFAHLEALQAACNMLGLVMEKRSNYTWYGYSVGDYALPPGMTKDQLGNNAEYVLSLGPDRLAKLPAGTKPYEIGIIPDPNNPGCYTAVYDFWNGGYGLSGVVGEPVRDAKGEVSMLAPKLKQHYDMACEAMAARQAGDRIEFLSAKEAHAKYPSEFPQTQDEETFVAISTGMDDRVNAYGG